jgi:hypothetical protein
MPDSWSICIAGRTYGPYSNEQMRDFAAEGRLARQSLVAKFGNTEFRKAGDIPDLAEIFAPWPASRDTTSTSRRDEGQGFGRSDRTGAGGRCHILVIADMKSGSVARIEGEIATFGPSFAILPQAWLLSTDASVNTVRNRLVQQLGKLDMLFVIDASNDKAAWFNFGPEADARIRKLWRTESKSRAAS